MIEMILLRIEVVLPVVKYEGSAKVRCSQLLFFLLLYSSLLFSSLLFSSLLFSLLLFFSLLFSSYSYLVTFS